MLVTKKKKKKHLYKLVWNPETEMSVLFYSSINCWLVWRFSTAKGSSLTAVSGSCAWNRQVDGESSRAVCALLWSEWGLQKSNPHYSQLPTVLRVEMIDLDCPVKSVWSLLILPKPCVGWGGGGGGSTVWGQITCPRGLQSEPVTPDASISPVLWEVFLSG